MPSLAETPVSVWLGRVLSGVVVLILLADGVVQLFAPELLRAEMEATGFAMHLARPLGIVMLICAVTYAVPQTSIVGAILVTAFLGGAICTHFRLGEIGSPPQLICLAIGAAAWAGLYLRDARLRALLPLAS